MSGMALEGPGASSWNQKKGTPKSATLLGDGSEIRLTN